MASRLGDQTARMMGRVTLNPRYHVDPIGTLLLPGVMIFGPVFGLGMFGRGLIGWAIPTPVNTRNFKNIKRDDMLVTLAGPASNLLLALLATLALAILLVAQSHMQLPGEPGSTQDGLFTLLSLAVQINLSLMFFNLLPIPPLDGSHIVRNLLPYNMLQTYDNISGIFGYILMVFVGGTIVRFCMGPSMALVNNFLFHVQMAFPG